MAESRLRDAWSRASQLLAALANGNPHRDFKRRRKPYQAAEFDPFAVAAARRRNKLSAGRLADEIMGPVEHPRRKRGGRSK